VAKTRIVTALQLAVGLLGAVAVAIAAAAAAGTVSVSLPPVGALLEACRSLLLPSASASGVAALVLGTASFAVIALGLRSAAGHVRRTRRFVRELTFPTDATLAGERVTVFDDHRPLAFCAGAVRPRIYVSTATLDALDDEQLAAVIAHEAHHARQRDPLRVLIARVLSDALFFLPATRRLGARYEELAELSADRAALRASRGQPAPLASALLSLEATGSAVIGIAPERVDHLMGEPTRWDLPLGLLLGAVVTITGILAVALRVEATSQAALNLPLFVMQLCMLTTATVPLMLGAAALLRARRRLRRA
jgi:Zn-dependent protease with chaperone function